MNVAKEYERLSSQINSMTKTVNNPAFLSKAKSEVIEANNLKIQNWSKSLNDLMEKAHLVINLYFSSYYKGRATKEEFIIWHIQYQREIELGYTAAIESGFIEYDNEYFLRVYAVEISDIEYCKLANTVNEFISNSPL